MLPGHVLTLIIFALTYAVIALGEIPWLRIDRTGAALAGAVAMVVSGALSEAAAEHAIDFHTIALLLGMMIVVANLRLSGAFAFFARALLSRARSGFGMLAMTVAASGLLAAFFHKRRCMSRADAADNRRGRNCRRRSASAPARSGDGE